MPERAVKRHALGVLFVHGIGEQQQGDTLLRCADPLVEWLEGWTRRAGVEPPSLGETNLSPEPATPAHTVLRGDLGGAGKLDWLLAESWWSETFRPPGPMSVAPWVWSVGKRMAKRQMRRFFGGHERSIRQAAESIRRSLGPFWRALVYLIMLPFLVVFFLAGPIFGWLALAVIRCAAFAGTLALVPLSVIPPLRPLVRRAQLAVTNGVGDSWVLKRSPTSLDAMVSRVQADLAWLEERADVVAVVAHSQGAVVAHRAISRRPAGRVRLFGTYGAALRLHYDDSGSRPGYDDLLWPDLAPEGPIAWSDCYAEWDPVAAGPIWRTRRDRRRSDPVENANSILSDHGGYWRNTEQFVAGLAAELAALTQTTIQRLTPSDADALRLADIRRTQRVGLLTAGRWLYIAGAGTATALLVPHSLADIGRWCVDALQGTLFFLLGGLGTRIGGHIDGRGAYYAVGALAVPAAVGILYRALVVTAWNRWSDKTKEALLKRETGGWQLLDRTLFGLTWLVVPAGLFTVWKLTDPDAWIAAFFSETGTQAIGPAFETVAWLYFAFIFAELWAILIFMRPASLARPPRPLRDASQVRVERDKHYALFDHRTRDGLRCACVCVRKIGLEDGRLRVPVLQAPPDQRLLVEVLEPADERARGRPPQYAAGQVVTLHGVGQLLDWDEYLAYRGHLEHIAAAAAQRTESAGRIPRVRGMRGTVGELAGRVRRRRESAPGLRRRPAAHEETASDEAARE